MIIPSFGAALAGMIAFALGLVAVGRYRGLPASGMGVLLLALIGLIVGSLTGTWFDQHGQNGDWTVGLVAALVIVVELIVITTSGRRPTRPPRG